MVRRRKNRKLERPDASQTSFGCGSVSALSLGVNAQITGKFAEQPFWVHCRPPIGSPPHALIAHKRVATAVVIEFFWGCICPDGGENWKRVGNQGNFCLG